MSISIGSAAQKCLTLKCVQGAYRYGLCMTCYGKAKKMVDSGQTIWDEIVSLGLATHDAEEQFFVDAFNEAKRRKDAETADRGDKQDMENG